jgi:hypothetical protein
MTRISCGSFDLNYHDDLGKIYRIIRGGETMNSHLLKLMSLFVVFVLVLSGCNLPGSAPSRPAADSATATGPAPTASATPVPEPPLTGFTDLLDRNLASGEWTQEQGLVTLLKLFAGEIQPGEVSLGPGLLEAEGSGVIDLSFEYLKNGKDDATKAEITRLLNILFPTQAALDLYSIPAAQAFHRSPGLAAPAPQGQDCAALWAAGFPDTRTPTFHCFLFGEGIVAGQRYRVYYPLAWHGDAIREAFYEATLEAAQASLTAFRAYGTIRPINFIFTTLDAAENPMDTLAMTYWDSFRPNEACPVIVFPSMLALDGNDFRQSVAHEVFHCFEAWNLHDQGIGAGYDSSKWWVEGAAEYFSNVVYPSTNYEYRFAGSFSNRSNTESLVAMTYENFIFFQFLGNKLGPVGVVGFLRRMPAAAGVDRQLAALAAVPGIEVTWEEFAKAVFDRTLLDSDSSVANIPASVTTQFNFQGPGSTTLSGGPFVLARHMLTFSGGKEFTVQATQAGAGRSAARPMGTTAAWQPIPATVGGGCSGIPYLVYTLTTTVGVERTETVTVSGITDKPCDRCLIGSWTSTSDSVLDYMRSIQAAHPDADVSVVDVAGSMFIEFNENGTASGGYNDLVVHQSIAGTSLTGVESTTDMYIHFAGTSTGTFSANGSVVTGSGGNFAITVNVDTFVNGVSMGTATIPFRPEDFPVTSATPTRYTCSGDTLTMWPPVPDISVAPIVYHKTNP